MTLTIPIEPLFILDSLHKAGFEAYLVGGAVRDLVSSNIFNFSHKVTDYDITSNATPEEIMQLFPEAFYENKFGTVSITVKEIQTQLAFPADQSYFFTPRSNHSEQLNLSDLTKIHDSLLSTFQKQETTKQSPPPFEITTFRSDGSYLDHRRPKSVTWGKDLESDLNRRDFTINAMAISVNSSELKKLFDTDVEYLPQTIELKTTQYQLIDPHHGLHDLEEGIIRTVGNPTARFEEDALRILRAIRLSAQLNMKIEAETFQALNTNVDLVRHVSQERIRDEFLKMLITDYAKHAIEMMDETGLLQYVIPELLATKGVQQGGHHTTDVWTHSLDALAECPSHDPVVKLATLLHDIAKPQTYQVQKGTITFYNHEIIGARIAKQIAHRLKLSRSDQDRIFTLVRFHMFHYQPHQTDAAIRRFMRNVGINNLNDILDLREGDRLGSGARKTSWRLEEMKERMLAQLNQPLAVTDLKINGHDLIDKLGMKPGPEIGRLLNQLFDEVLENPQLNTTDKLLTRAQELTAKKH